MTTPGPRTFTGTEARLLLRRARTAALGTVNLDPAGPYVSLANIETMDPDEVFLPENIVAAVMASADSAILHMNADHADTVGLYAERLLGGGPGEWQITSIDPDGAHLQAEERVLRLNFDRPAEKG